MYMEYVEQQTSISFAYFHPMGRELVTLESKRSVTCSHPFAFTWLGRLILVEHIKLQILKRQFCSNAIFS